MRFPALPARSPVLLVVAVTLAVGGWISLSQRSQQAEIAEKTGDLYDIRLPDARAKLRFMGLPETMLGATPGYVIDGESDSYCLFWILQKQQQEVFRFVVAMAAEGDGTRIWTDVQAPSFDSRNNLITPDLHDYPAVKSLYAAAIREQVRATPENRPVNPVKIDQATRAEAQAFLGEMSK